MSQVVLERRSAMGIADRAAEAVSIEPVLQLENLFICADKGKEHRLLVKDLSLTIRPGETAALVGESGSGKSLTTSAVLGLLPPHMQLTEGRILLCGENIANMPDKARRRLRGSRIGIVFQHYQSSFTPFMTIGRQMAETLRSHQRLSRKEAFRIAQDWLELAGLPAARVLDSYPFQLSGGQLQRTALVSAMMLEPDLLIADEPTTALDVLAGEHVLDLLAKLQSQTGCAVLLISHDLRQVLKRADTVAVMRDGRLLEIKRADQIKSEASHPYTKMLLEARPELIHIEQMHKAGKDVMKLSHMQQQAAARAMPLPLCAREGSA